MIPGEFMQVYQHIKLRTLHSLECGFGDIIQCIDVLLKITYEFIEFRDLFRFVGGIIYFINSYVTFSKISMP